MRQVVKLESEGFDESNKLLILGAPLVELDFEGIPCYFSVRRVDAGMTSTFYYMGWK